MGVASAAQPPFVTKSAPLADVPLGEFQNAIALPLCCPVHAHSSCSRTSSRRPSTTMAVR
jgi:hypothetical protein